MEKGYIKINNEEGKTPTVEAQLVTLEFQYNDNGYLSHYGGEQNGTTMGGTSYTYEYDSQGNWTKQVGTSETGSVTTITREYTYWSTTGINTISQATTLKAWVADGTLHVSGLTAGEAWSVYNVAGACVYQGVAAGNAETLSAASLPNHGVYIILSEGKTVKIVK